MERDLILGCSHGGGLGRRERRQGESQRGRRKVFHDTPLPPTPIQSTVFFPLSPGSNMG